MGRLIGCIFLIIGTSIGAGMLALPLATGGMGFLLSSFFICFVAWLMYQSALAMTECSLQFEPQDNIVTMARALSGRLFYVSAIVCNFLLLYVLQVAYLRVGSDVLSQVFVSWLPHAAMAIVFPLLLVVFLVFLLIKGVRHIDIWNRIFVISMLLGVLVLVVFVLRYFDFQNIKHIEIRHSLSVLPLLALSFGFHPLIPSLVAYQNNDSRGVVRALRWGFCLIVSVYLLWQLALLAAIPYEGVGGLSALAHAPNQIAALEQMLTQVTGSSWMEVFFSWLGISALLSSLIGVALSLRDMVRDLLVKSSLVRSDKSAGVWAALVTVLPSYVFYLISGASFVALLEKAGILVMYIIIVVPSVLLIKLRRRQGYAAKQLTHLAMPWILIAFSCCLALIYIFM